MLKIHKVLKVFLFVCNIVFFNFSFAQTNNDYDMAISYLSNNNFQKSYMLFQSAIRNNDYRGYCGLGFLYINGYGVEKDIEKAVFWLKIGIKNNDICSITMLGKEYFYGNNVKKDNSQALQLFLTIPDNLQEPEVSYILAKEYFTGNNIKQDYDKSLTLFKKSEKWSKNSSEYINFITNNKLIKNSNDKITYLSINPIHTNSGNTGMYNSYNSKENNNNTVSTYTSNTQSYQQESNSSGLGTFIFICLVIYGVYKIFNKKSSQNNNNYYQNMQNITKNSQHIQTHSPIINNELVELKENVEYIKCNIVAKKEELFKKIDSQPRKKSTAKNTNLSQKYLLSLFNDALPVFKKYFFEFSPGQLHNFLIDYEPKYGPVSTSYVKKTYQSWKNGTTKLSATSFGKVIDIIPFHLNARQRYEILEILVKQYKRNKHHNTIRINLKNIPEDIRQLTNILNNINYTYAKLAFLPDSILEIADWLYDSDITLARAILAEEEKLRMTQIDIQAKQEIQLIINKIQQTKDSHTHYSYNVEMSNIFLRIETYSPSFCIISTTLFGNDALETNILRKWRDDFLINYNWGKIFIFWYYANGNKLAFLLTYNIIIKTVTRLSIKVFVCLIRFIYFLKGIL